MPDFRESERVKLMLPDFKMESIVKFINLIKQVSKLLYGVKNLKAVRNTTNLKQKNNFYFIIFMKWLYLVLLPSFTIHLSYNFSELN
jgi:hypothetical protein